MEINSVSISTPYFVIITLAVLVLVLLALLFHSVLERSKVPLSELKEKLASLEEATVQMREIGREISSLKTILHAPKLRGNFGEYLLNKLLKDTLPPQNFSTQYQFSDGAAVDSIIRLGKNIIPIDSKFPLESFERFLSAEDIEGRKKAKSEFTRSVKGRIDEISKKYIRPEEGTFDFALMYIPSERVYYEILTGEAGKGWELFEYSMKSRVIPVSPNTFYAYLMSIVYGLKGLKIEEQAENIIKKLGGIQKNFSDLQEEMAVLGRHISNTNSKFSEIQEKAVKIENLLNQNF